MSWYAYVAHVFAGALLTNALPHLVHGLSGHKFQTPFASPRGVGESSAIVNVLWGLFNVAVGVLLLEGVGPFSGSFGDWIAMFLGALAIGLYLASHFSKVRKGPAGP